VGTAEGRLARASEHEAGALRVAYVMSRFPKITETFVLLEMLALEEQGIAIEVFPLLREHEAKAHVEAQAFVERAHYHPFLSWAIVRANLHYLRTRPGRYLGTVFQALTRTLRSPNYFGGALVFLPKAALFAREMESAGVAHVHAHFANHPALVALVVHRLTGIPFSFTAHGSDLHVDQTALAWKVAESAFAVTVSRYNREFVRERAGDAAADKLKVIHCGIDPGLHAREREPEGAGFEILCVAALRTVKGHRHLIEACRILSAQGLAFRCHLIGGGPLQRELESTIAAAGLRGRVLLHGSLPRDVVLERMRSAHVLVLPSIQDREGRREGIPVTLMEAMSCGLPVVASRISGIPELVEDERSGLLTPPGDAPAIAAALTRLAGSPELRARLGRVARVGVRRDFDLRAGAERLAEEIRAVRSAGTPAGAASAGTARR
jgi:colanic acid/amylovoran biosynthesis glycosyltransferase